jgi:hypothetical protein
VCVVRWKCVTPILFVFVSSFVRVPDAADAGGVAAGFDFGDAARMAAEFAPVLGGAPAAPPGSVAIRLRARAHAHALAHAHARTRTRMLTLARMLPRFCFHVSLFCPPCATGLLLC